jgi:hypothetical protein
MSNANKRCANDDKDVFAVVDTQQQQQQTAAVIASRNNNSLLDAWLDSYRRFQQQHRQQEQEQQQQQQQYQEHDGGGVWFLFVFIKVRLLIGLEIALSWIVCILCAIYYISRYQFETWSVQIRMRTRRRIMSYDDDDLLWSLPLMTEARHQHRQDEEEEDDRLVANNSMEEQHKVLQSLLDRRERMQYQEDDDDDDVDDDDEDYWNPNADKDSFRRHYYLVRDNPDIRRLASRFFMTGMEQQQHPSFSSATITTTTPTWMALHEELKRIWSSVLPLPPLFAKEEEEEEEAAAASSDGSPSGSAAAAASTTATNDCGGCLRGKNFDIALIVPAFAESGQVLRRTLLCARDHCRNAQNVVVVVVNAGQCTDLHLLQQTLFASDSSSTSLSTSCGACQEDINPDTTTFIASSSSSSWGAFALIPFQQQHQQQQHDQSCSSGRGPTLNYGAAWVQSHISNTASTGRRRKRRPLILTFLHADTLLPQDWDVHVQNALALPKNDGQEHGNVNKRKIVQACAFSFGHDLSEEGLSLYHQSNANKDTMPSSSTSSPSSSSPLLLDYPWGIRAVQWLGNCRATYARLPYGDHVISMPDVYFHYLGGFPNQPIMEDFELMDLLRKRARILNSSDDTGPEEGIAIIPARALCSTRRWQKHGVVYTTLVNALIVHRYSKRDNAWTPDDVFDYYYNNSNYSSTRREQQAQQRQPSPTSENSSNKKDD